ncbi:hypothetical protein BS50DRAFT_681345 [Corynespora cassiicola Philippines]|uniref:Inner kinetochore subunit AME1 domain-containing protein n=1 Tax=Corynespora cassiicola Philippines TaxID=1448308 RepID=A0A2T2N6A0_CORCC|nr:hypothetical protein BS50DRAFT_681345 [Corynespora cassiicola Philippines]
MAPIDRNERRQQRIRGAGASSVQTSFGFNFGALALRTSKQASLPPQPFSRRSRTPVQSTPRGPPGSAKRYRSASIQRSTGKRQRSTPRERTITPNLGKRKRGSSQALANEDDGQPDDLTPSRDEHIRSTEKSRRIDATVSPIHEETVEEAPDELSFAKEPTSSARKTQRGENADVPQQTPVPTPPSVRQSSTNVLETPAAGPSDSASVDGQNETIRRSRSTEKGPGTPALLHSNRPRKSASKLNVATSNGGPEQEESEDELSPPQPSAITSRVYETQPTPEIPNGEEMEVDELSSPAQVSAVQQTPMLPTATQQKSPTPQEEAEESIHDHTPAPKPKRRGRPRRVVSKEDDVVQSTPAANKPRRFNKRVSEAEKEAGTELDELSPEGQRIQDASAKFNKEVVHISEPLSEHETSDQEPEEESGSAKPSLKAIVAPRKPSPGQHNVKAASNKRPKKRAKLDTGEKKPKISISVMRLEGSNIKGVTVADTARSLLDEGIQHRVDRMGEKLRNTQNTARRKEIKSRAMLALAFKESVSEKLLDLQDANDTITVGLKKLKTFKADNTKLRKEILAYQNNRQEIALELDEVQAGFDAEKRKVDARQQLSSNLFDIQAAIEAGKARARDEGREDEGPDVPLSMLLDTVGADVGSAGGGLLANLKGFNSLLERAAGWLEGRA